jgi:membrane protein DedA with SNARE-associated domain
VLYNSDGTAAVVAGAISTVLFLYLGWFVFSGNQNPTDMQRLASVVFWFGLPLLWAAALIGTGIRILTRRDRRAENCRSSDALSDRAV